MSIHYLYDLLTYLNSTILEYNLILQALFDE